MKKKIFSLLIICILVFGLTGCGVSKEKVLKNANKLNMNDFIDDISENELKAKEKYENNYYVIKGSVSSIKDGNIKLMTNSSTEFKVPLDNEEIKKISNSQIIEVAGKLLKIENNNGDVKIEMDKSYLKSDSFLITGIVKIPARKHLVNFVDYTGRQKSRTYYDEYKDSEWFLEIGDYKITSAEKQNFYGEGETIILGKKVEDGANVSVMGKIYNHNEIKDISKIKINS